MWPFLQGLSLPRREVQKKFTEIYCKEKKRRDQTDQKITNSGSCLKIKGGMYYGN